MRLIGVVVVVALLVGGALLLGSTDSGEQAGTRLTRLASSVLQASESDTRVLYQFVDASGNVRVVESLDEVPPDRRAGVGRIEVPIEPAQTAKASSAPEVTIYTTVWCGFCAKMVEELEALQVRYHNRDIERDPGAREELVRLVGSTGVPVTVVGRDVIRGYDPDRLRTLVARAR